MSNTPIFRTRPLARSRQAWHWWRSLRHNPISLRERGQWGRPNPYFDQINRFAPFIALGTLLIGACSAWLNPLLLSQNSEAVAIFCLLCLPGILLTVFTWYGMIMAPALTAPAISLEINAGTWDAIRATPYSDLTIVGAKFYGALTRLRIWSLLGIFSLIQGAILFIFGLLLNGAAGPLARTSIAVSLGLCGIARPWLEVLSAGILGMNLSTRIRSTSMALAGSYGGLLIIKLFNNSLLWSAFNRNSSVMPIIGPTLVYLAIAIILTMNLGHRIAHLGETY